jgi:hypothetical protein
MAQKDRLPRGVTPPAPGQESWEVKCTWRSYTVALPTDAYLPMAWGRNLQRNILNSGRGLNEPPVVDGIDLVDIRFTDTTAETLELRVKRLGLRPGSIGSLPLRYDPQLGPLFRLAAQCSRADRDVDYVHPIWNRYWRPLTRLAAERDSTFDRTIRRDLQDQIDDRCAALVIEARRYGVMTADRQIQDWLADPQQAMLSFEQFEQTTAEWERRNRHHFTGIDTTKEISHE